MVDEFALVLNSGSSSLKFAVFRTAAGADWPLVGRGNIEGIGTAPKMSARDGAGSAMPTPTLPAAVRDASAALEHVFAWLRSSFAGGRLVGDADLRGIGDGRAELAIMIGARALQGRGLGTAFGVMAHALAFRTLGLTRTCVSILPENAASRRLFQRLGYALDYSPAARAIADEPTDLTMSLERARCEKAYAAELTQLQFYEMSGSGSLGR